MSLAVNFGRFFQIMYELFQGLLVVAGEVYDFMLSPINDLVAEFIGYNITVPLVGSYTPVSLMIGAGLIIFLVFCYVKFILNVLP